MQDLSELMPVVDGFPRPDWQSIAAMIEARPEHHWQADWEGWVSTWLKLLSQSLQEGYRVLETENFFLLTAQHSRYANLLTEFLERALNQVLTTLKGVASDAGYGKHVVLLFDEHDAYYRYKSYFYPDEGDFILSAGSYLHTDYGHFAFPFMDMDEAEATAAHELTHACLAHLPLPLWLNEGLAVTMEGAICNYRPHDRHERLPEHMAYWNLATMQDFWSGDAFGRPDEGSSLSYELASWCVQALVRDYEAFVGFANGASFEDAGAAAALNHYGFDLGLLMEQFLGTGEWSPRPAAWPG